MKPKHKRNMSLYKNKNYLVRHFKRNNETISEIARRFDVSVPTVFYFLVKLGVHKPKRIRTN